MAIHHSTYYKWKNYLLFILLLVSEHHYTNLVFAETLKIGLLLPNKTTWTLGAQRSAAYMAMDDINKDTTLLPNIDLAIEYKDSDCSPIKSAGSTADLYFENRVNAFIGPHCSDSCVPSGYLAAYYKIPMISHACSAAQLSNKENFPTFARTKAYGRTDKKKLVEQLVKVMDLFDWEYISIISSRKVAMFETAQYIFQYIGEKSITNKDNKNVKIKVQERYLFTEPDNDAINVREQLNRAKNDARVILLLAHPKPLAQILIQARELGMFDVKDDAKSERYTFITTGFNIKESWTDEDWFKEGLVKVKYHKDRWRELFNGVIDFRMQTPNRTIVEGFHKKVVAGMNDPRIPDYQYIKNEKMKKKASGDAANLYDAVMVYADAVTNTIKAGKDHNNMNHIMDNIFNKTFKGVLKDEFKITKNGDREAMYYELHNFRKKEGDECGGNDTACFIHVCDLRDDGNANIAGGKPCIKSGNKRDESLTDKIQWPCMEHADICNEIPSDQPECGFDDDKCGNKDSQHVIVILVILFVVLFVAMILVFILFKKRKFERDLLGEGFFIKYQDIENNCINGQVGRGGGSISSRVAVMTTGLMFPESMSVQSTDTVDKNQFTYNGQTVIKRTLDKTNANITREMLLEFKMVRELHNINLCTVVGVCIQSPSLCILMSYCSKGSLQDVLQNSDIKLDNMFQGSFCSDISNGMSELHRNGIVHGALHSENCVIDNRWVCKVTDFGMDKFKQAHTNSKDENEEDYSRLKKLFWRAPELLDKESVKKTKEGDVYSYAIIMSEIMSREDPYGDYGMDAKDIVNLVAKRDEPVFRPRVKEDEFDKRLIALMKQCWSDSPFDRPDFNAIKAKLKRISGKQGNLVDNMIDMMEKYTNNLEELVEQRTEELAAEKLKTDDLLYKMLPKAVTEQLKNGNQVNAESFECVTIFFSDIVGFTALAAASTPMQVVALLNDLYTCFDTCSDQYDVYKVETIGDAYMVVSGLPDRNGNEHAGEIATLSLDLLHNIRTFRVRHLPDTHMQLRIGIHSGPCVAGVVGLKMPRYCLFGDTVNYASRMESSGLALRVHVSPECKEILDELGKYKLQDRGPVKMKGKGTINTYFLVGKEGFDKELPDLANAASLADHEFK